MKGLPSLSIFLTFLLSFLIYASEEESDEKEIMGLEKKSQEETRRQSRENWRNST